MPLKQEITALMGRNVVLTWARAPWGWVLIGMVEYQPTPSNEG